MEKAGKTSSEEGPGVSPAFPSWLRVDAEEAGEEAPPAFAVGSTAGSQGKPERSAQPGRPRGCGRSAARGLRCARAAEYRHDSEVCYARTGPV